MPAPDVRGLIMFEGNDQAVTKKKKSRVSYYLTLPCGAA